ncbi:hypothetical protein [Paenibacillus eucommiae]|uniref:Transposase n=1 Tax=Paenibacillus eucommiae TaxID=1355755 RepID=A0ABS4ISQ8_9BACL|nr:hypothetical protein [Paenibacillus eucommiae]MBP1990606.1 hypothetical protein [Paenibacillus eucommiae]
MKYKNGCVRWRTVLHSQAPAPARKSLLTKRKTLAGSPFELVVRVIRAIVAEKREWLWVEER